MLCILAGLLAAAQTDASPPRRFLSDDTVLCEGERTRDFCNCHTDCRETGEDAKFCACPEAQACCECRDSDAWAKTDDPDKGCAWVAEFPGVPGDWKRCRAKGTIGGTLGKVSRPTKASRRSWVAALPRPLSQGSTGPSPRARPRA